MTIEPSFRVASYNICNPALAKDFASKADQDFYGPANWGSRYVKILENIHQIDADIISISGCSAQITKDLSASFPSFSSISTKHAGTDDGLLILFNKSIFTKEDETITHLSAMPRSNCCLTLRDTAVRTKIKFVTSQLSDQLSETYQIAHSSSLKNLVEERGSDYYANTFMIIAADFAHPRNHAVVKVLTDEGYLNDGDSSPTNSFTNERVDFIFRKVRYFNDLWGSQVKEEDSYLMRKVKITLPHPNASHHLPAVTDFFRTRFVNQDFTRRTGASIYRKSSLVNDCSQRSLAQNAHQDDIEYLIGINESYRCFSDDNERKIFDEMLKNLPERPAPPPFNAPTPAPALPPASAPPAIPQPVIVRPVIKKRRSCWSTLSQFFTIRIPEFFTKLWKNCFRPFAKQA